MKNFVVSRCTALCAAGLAVVVGGSVTVRAHAWASGQPAAEPSEPVAQGQPAPASTGRPIMSVANPEVELGTLLDVERTKFKIDFTNSGEGVLVITRVQPSCGCTAAAPNKTEYLPGESGVIEGEVDPRGKEGPLTKSITIFTNDPERPTTMVSFRSMIEPLVKIEPKVLNFAKVENAVGKSMFVTLTSGSPDFKATMATMSDDRFSASVIKTEDIEIGGKSLRRSTVEVKVEKGARVGRGTATVAIRTNEPRADLMNVQVVAEVLGELEISPSPTTLGNLPAGEPFEAKITMRSRTGKAVKVNGVELRRPNNLGIEVSIESAETNTFHTITVKGVAPERGGAMQGELAVLTSNPGEEEIKITFYGFVRAGTQAGSPVQSIPPGGPAQPRPAVRPVSPR